MDWRPIETAPRDARTWVLIHAILPSNGEDRILCMRWKHVVKGPRNNRYRVQRWVGGGMQFTDAEAWHWMPLPEPPSVQLRSA